MSCILHIERHLPDKDTLSMLTPWIPKIKSPSRWLPLPFSISIAYISTYSIYISFGYNSPLWHNFDINTNSCISWKHFHWRDVAHARWWQMQFLVCGKYSQEFWLWEICWHGTGAGISATMMGFSKKIRKQVIKGMCFTLACLWFVPWRLEDFRRIRESDDDWALYRLQSHSASS